MGVWQGVAMVSLKFHPGPPCPTYLCPAGGLPLKRPYRYFRGGQPKGRAACSNYLPFLTPHAVRPCLHLHLSFGYHIFSSHSTQAKLMEAGFFYVAALLLLFSDSSEIVLHLLHSSTHPWEGFTFLFHVHPKVRFYAWVYGMGWPWTP
jgi:hypothetical protein